MSDEEYDAEGWGDSNEEEEDNDSNDPERDIRNNFYEGEGIYKEKPSEALTMFETVIETEETYGNNYEFTFNATKYIVILTMQLGQYDKMLKH
jgi:hypothetical protein